MAESFILVTGGAGFIGSHTVVELLEEGESVVIIDNLSNAASDDKGLPPALKRVQDLVNEKHRKRLHFRKGNYGDRKILDSIFTEFPIKAVVHFGAFKAVGESKQVPMKYYKNNVKEALSLLKAMNAHGVKNLIFSSSCTVYAEVPPEKLPLTEDSPLGECNCAYASSKYFIENILRDVAVSDGQWKVMSLRYFNPVGAHHSGMIGEDPKGIPTNLMPYIAQVAVGRRDELNVFGSDYPTPDGTPVRDYVHVVDIAKGHVAALKALPAMQQSFRAYNLGSGVGTSVLEMVQAFERASGVVIKTVMQDRRPGDQAFTYCQPRRAFEELGWKTEKTVDDMCADIWRFQKQNPNGYIPLKEAK